MKQAASANIPKAQGVIPTDDDRARLSALVHAVGEREARTRLNLGRQTMARIVAGLPVRVATLEYLRTMLTRETP